MIDSHAAERTGAFMGTIDAQFAGSIPGLYDRHLGPLLFEPYAEESAGRAAALRPGRILETAAGTGIVTAALAKALPEAEIVATDLNQAMLDVAATRVRSERVQFQVADAQDLPVPDGAFDLVLCQFGVMFYPDKVRGHAEARRVLRDGGKYLAIVWDRLDRNTASHAVHDAVAAMFPDDPPGFLARTPFGYADPQQIEGDLRSAGFSDINIDTVELRSRPSATPRDAAVGLVYGCPLKTEIEERDPSALERAEQAATEALGKLVSRTGAFHSTLSAHVVTATK